MGQFSIWISIIIGSLAIPLWAGQLDAYAWTCLGQWASERHPRLSLWGFQQARKALPQHPHTQFNHAIALSRAGRYQDAQALLCAIDHAPLSPRTSAFIYQWMASLYEQQSQLEKALIWSRKAVMADPGASPAVTQRHRLLVKSDRVTRFYQVPPLTDGAQARLLQTAYQLEWGHRMGRSGVAHLPKGWIQW